MESIYKSTFQLYCNSWAHSWDYLPTRPFFVNLWKFTSYLYTIWSYSLDLNIFKIKNWDALKLLIGSGCQENMLLVLDFFPPTYAN